MRTTHPLASRIKKLLQSDEDVGRINMHTPHVAGCAVEELVRQLCGGAAAVAKDRGLKTVTGPCLKAYVQTLSPAIWDHFMDILEKVPDLAEKGAPQPKAKRPRQPKASADPSNTATSPKRSRAQSKKTVPGLESANVLHDTDQVQAEALEQPQSPPTDGRAGMPGAKEPAPDQDEDRRVWGADVPLPEPTSQGQQVENAVGHVHDGQAQAQAHPLSPQAAAAAAPGIEDEEDDYDDI